MATSIAVARAIGPERLGYYVFLSFITLNLAGKLVGTGPGAAARKYFAEYLATEQMGLVRWVFFATLRMQIVASMVIVAIGLSLVFTLGDPSYRAPASLLVICIAPALVSQVPALLNVAAERFSRNLPGALAGLLAYTTTIVLTLTFDWGLTGVASAMLVRRTIEFLLRFMPALKWMNSLPRDPHPEFMQRNLLVFSGQALAISVVTTIVWDRSEVLFLKQFSTLSDLAFYSVAFMFAEYLLYVPQIYGLAASAAIMTEYNRNPDGAAVLSSNAVRHLSLLMLPAHFGLAALSAPAIAVAYGTKYIPAIPVLIIAAILAFPKGFYWLPTAFYQAANQQHAMLKCLLIPAAINLLLDAALIPRFGAIGAAMANGIAQFLTVAMLWRAGSGFRVPLPWGSLARIFASAVFMATVVAGIGIVLPPALALPLGVISGCVIYLAGLRLLQVLTTEDVRAFESLTVRLPSAWAAGIIMNVARALLPAHAQRELITNVESEVVSEKISATATSRY